MTFSILILSRNEEVNLDKCLASVNRFDDVVVLDSFSTDRTVELAKTAGARLYQRVFDDFASQRNHALDYIDFKHPWVFHLDADERFTEELRQECRWKRPFAERGAARHSFWSSLSLWAKPFLGRFLREAGFREIELRRVGRVPLLPNR